MSVKYGSLEEIRTVCLLTLMHDGCLSPRFGANRQSPHLQLLPPHKEENAAIFFAAVAAEVLQQMRRITGMKLRAPLKKTLRSRKK